MSIPMTDREKEVLQIAVSIVQKEMNPAKIILFGSRAEGRGTPESDFDLAIDCDPPNFTRRREIAEALDEAVGLYEVDLVYLPAVEPDFRELIQKKGKVVYER